MDLKQTEKKTWGTQFIDGTTDIGIGLLIAVSTVLRFNPGVSYYHYLWMLLPIPFMILAKKYITTPRIGIVKFSRERVRADRMFVLIAAIIIAVGFSIIFILIATKKEWLQAIPYPMVIVGVALFIIWSSIAYFRDFPRLYLYAFLGAISVMLTGTNTQNNPAGVLAWSITAVVMIVIGIYYLIKFIKKYPLPKGNTND
jgi:hypothetical protein